MSDTILEVPIDESLVGNVHIIRGILEVFQGIGINANGNGLLQLLGIGIWLGISKVVFFFHGLDLW